MAGRYTKLELKEMLCRSAFHVVMEEGIEHLTVRKVANGCGLSDPYIYQCYSDLQDMLEAVFMKIDGDVAKLMQKIIANNIIDVVASKDLEKMCWEMWKAYWDFLMADPEQTVFYWRYYQSAYYTKEMLMERRGHFETFVNFISKVSMDMKISDKINPDVIVSNIIDSTVSVAVKIHLGFIEKDAITEKTVYRSVFALLFHLAGKDIWEDE